MILQGKARRFKQDDDINTDYIISGRYKFKIQKPEELAQYVMEDLDPDFKNRYRVGDFIVAGKNFGCGSSREQAPQAIKYAGVGAVIARSFARIFYRNSFNIGLLLVECETDQIKEADELVLDLENGVLKDVTQGLDIKMKPLPAIMAKLLEDGGIINHFKKYGGFKL